jgi:GT2 family glycosyltransferase
MNVGIRHALESGADAVLLVNSDVVVPVEAIAALECALDARPDAGIAGPIAVDRATPDRIVSQGISYDRASGRMKNCGAGRPLASAPAALATVDGVSGCLMLVTRQVFDAIGLLDERYFYSFEDLEFCLRARQAGFATVVAPRAIVLHEGSRSIGAGSVRRLYYAARNHLLLAAEVGRTGPLALARSMYVVLLNVAHAMRAPGRATSSRLLAVASGTRDYLRGRFGE